MIIETLVVGSLAGFGAYKVGQKVVHHVKGQKASHEGKPRRNGRGYPSTEYDYARHTADGPIT